MKYIFSLILLLTTLPALPQANIVVSVRKYTQSNGLSSYNVRKIVRDQFGLIWVATQEGLSSFDGKVFKNYSKSATYKHRLCGIDIRDLAEDSITHLLWVLPGEIGINAIDEVTGNVVNTFPIPGFGPEDWSICMSKTGDELWIGTSTGVKIFDCKKKLFKPGLPLPEGLAPSIKFETRCISKDRWGNFWVGYSGYGIVVYNVQTKRILGKISIPDLYESSKSSTVKFLNGIQNRIDQMLFATSEGLRQISFDSLYDFHLNKAPVKVPALLNSESIEFVSKDKQGAIFIAGHHMFYRFDSTLQSFNIIKEASKFSQTDWLSSTQTIYHDNENNVWLGCQEGLGLINSSVSPFKAYCYDEANNTKLEHVRSLFSFDNGNILAGLRNGIVFIDKASGRYVKHDTAHLYHHIFLDKNGHIHVSRDDGMFIYTPGAGLVPVDKVYPEFSAFAGFPINSHLFFGDTLIVMGTETDNGILLWDTRNSKVKQLQKGFLSSGTVNNIFADSQHRLWILSDNIITILSREFKMIKEIKLQDTITGLPYNLFFDACEANGYYWIASYGFGVLQVDSLFNVKYVLNHEKGLSNDGVYQLYAIGQNKIMVTTNYGLSVIDINSKQSRSYYMNDGLHSNAFEEVCGFRKDSLIYAGGLNGFTIVNPSFFYHNKRPPVLLLSDVRIKTENTLYDTCNLFSGSITVPDNALQTAVYFSGINYSNPEATIFRYKIAELHQNWILNGAQNFIELIGIQPGSYHLLIQAANEDGIWSEPKELTLIFLPKWYQTWWFKVLLWLIAAAAIYSLYRIRINQLKREEQIRSRLASDLHDDLGSTMNSVKIYANLAIMEKENNEYLLKVKEGTQEAIAGLRDMIWVLDDKKDTIEDLLGRIEQFAAPLCKANNIQFLLSVQDDARRLPLRKEEKRNLYMIFKETINNSIKYSSCTRIELKIEESRNHLSITITDNGNGFDQTKISYGNGIKNMYERAKEAGYNAILISAPGDGTSLSLKK